MNPGFVDVLQMLPVPETAGPLRGRGARGRCVWCGQEPELSLGPRLKVIDRKLHRWMPRACEPCARRKAAQVYASHRGSCARCTEREYCLDARALYCLANGQPDGLIREARPAAPVTP